MKSTIISIIVAVIFILGSILLVNNKGNDQYVDYNNVTIVDGKQIVEINAKGGYFPRISQAKADIPTIIRFNTSNTFDCSASIRIPSVGVSKILPNTGSTDIDIGVQKAGKFRGSCGMGMYPFEIEFVN
jgi:plastocyanin domain-containing protein